MTQTIIITGASSGIGYELAKLYAQAGFNLGLLARRLDLLNELKSELESKYAIKVFVEACDVAQLDQCQKSIQNLSQALGGLDIFIANAGFGLQTPAWKPSWPTVRQILEINLMGAIASIEAAKDIMLPQKKGQLVGITSIAGFRGLPTSSGYSTSKVALTAYLECIRADLKQGGLGVTAIHPGFIETFMTQKNKYKMPFLLSAPVAAQMIFDAIQKKKSRYVFPWQMKILVGFLYHLPDCVYDFLMGLVNFKRKS